MYCTKCGKQIEDDSKFCNYCGERVKTVQPAQPAQAQEQTGAQPLNDRRIGIKLMVGLLLALLVALGINRCCKDAEKNEETDSDDSYSSSYASSHSSNSMSAYTYALLYLKESNVSITHNSSYTVCTGTIKNTGTSTVSFVKIKGAFTDYSGNVVDTDWTYAVGSEGLAPGESTTFRMSIPKNSSVKTCKISFISD